MKNGVKESAQSIQAPLLEESLAQAAQRLNTTLLDHLSPDTEDSRNAAGERSLAILATKNCIRRINFRYPDDVLTEDGFANIATDLLEAVDGNSPNRSTVLNELRRFQTLGFIIPCYRVLNRFKGKKEILPLHLGVYRCFYYSAEGDLKEIRFGRQEENFPCVPPSMSPVQYYRDKKLLIENPQDAKPGSKPFQCSLPLFTFSQIAEFMKIHRAASLSVNLLLTTPTEYKELRAQMLPRVKAALEETGVPRLCQNPTCVKPLSNDPRNRYCSDQCQRRAIDARKRAKKKKRGNLTEPFVSFVEAVSLPSTE